MKVFVTGASGYLGTGITLALAKAGHEVWGLSRSEKTDAALRARGVRPVRGALGNLRTLGRELAGYDALVHAAMDYGLGPPADREAIEALLDAARAASGPVGVVYTSGVWVLGDAPAPAPETASTDRPAAAVAWRPPHERIVLGAATDRIATAVVRPGIVFGERRGLLVSWWETAVNEGRTAFVGPGTQRWPFVHQTDLGELYRLVVDRRARGIFHGVDGASPKVEEAAAAASRAAGKGGATRAIPLEEGRRTMGPLADALAMDQVVVSARAGEVGWAPRHRPFLDEAESAFREWRG